MKQSIKISRTAHYYIQIPNKPIKSIIYCIHGYAQLAEEFIKEFRPLQETNSLVIAPEAISKFYNKERKAVANWMTSHERMDEIEDYISYLNELHQKVTQQYGDFPVSILGFSQGVSTCMRWIANSPIVPSNIFLCSGSIPPELSVTEVSHLTKTNLIYYYGTKDRLLLPEKAIEQVNLLISIGFNPSIEKFEGRHEIPEVAIENLIYLNQTLDK